MARPGDYFAPHSTHSGAISIDVPKRHNALRMPRGKECRRRAPSPQLQQTACLTDETAYMANMKAIGWILAAAALTGCATQSRFASDPRAAAVGPDYLDYIAEYPRDKDTELYAPWFTLDDRRNKRAYERERVGPLETALPMPSQEAIDTAGKGYPLLERRAGLLVFTGTENQTRLTEKPTRSFFRQFWLP